MKVRQLPNEKSVKLSSLKPGAVFQYNSSIYIRVNDNAGTLRKKTSPVAEFHVFNVTASILSSFDEDVHVQAHKKAVLVLDGSTLEEVK